MQLPAELPLAPLTPCLPPTPRCAPSFMFLIPEASPSFFQSHEVILADCTLSLPPSAHAPSAVPPPRPPPRRENSSPVKPPRLRFLVAAAEQSESRALGFWNMACSSLKAQADCWGLFPLPAHPSRFKEIGPHLSTRSLNISSWGLSDMLASKSSGTGCVCPCHRRCDTDLLVCLPLNP